MPRKTKIIFIIVFIIVGAVMLGFYYAKQGSNSTEGDGSGGGYSIFNPFGSKSPSPEINESNTNNNENDYRDPALDESGVDIEDSKLYKITTFAVAGATFFEDTRPIVETQIEGSVSLALPGGENPPPTPKKTTTKVAQPKFEVVPSLRYVERVTGHIYQLYLDTKVENKISNSTIPSIYEAVFDGNAKSVIYRYLSGDKIITSFMATLGSSKGEFLPSNISGISISPDKTKFFYLTKTSSGVVGTTRSFANTKKDQVFSSSFSEWLPQWATNQKIFLTTKPSALVNGSLFVLNTVNGSMSKVFGGVRGLTTLVNRAGTYAIFSSSTSSGPSLEILDIDKHTTVDLGIYGLPEKCVWNNNNTFIYCAIPNNISGSQYPDSWYQGLVSFDDNFVKINANTYETTTLITSNYAESVDATELFLNKEESVLFFINKKDGTLWGLDLE